MARRRSIPTVIAPDLTVHGNLVTEGHVQVEGFVEGDIHAHTINVGHHAKVKGAVFASFVSVYGTVEGPIHTTTLTLADSANITGDISYSRLETKIGALVEGYCHQVQSVELPPLPISGETAAETAPNDNPKPLPKASAKS